MITQEEIDEQVAAVEAAEVVLDRAEAHHAGTGSPTAVSELLDAKGTAHAARDKLRRLRAAWAKDQADRAARTAAEKAFAPEAPTVATALDESRGEAVQALRDAEEAVERLLTVCGEYDTAVRAVAADLRQRGLTADDSEPLGGARTGQVRLNEGTHLPLDPPSVLADMLARVMRGRDRRHPLALLTTRGFGGQAAVAGRDALADAARVGVSR